MLANLSCCGPTLSKITLHREFCFMSMHLPAGMGISWLVQRWKNKPVQLFMKAQQEAAEGRMHIESVAVLKSIYR
jgi:hypothetical protein